MLIGRMWWSELVVLCSRVGGQKSIPSHIHLYLIGLNVVQFQTINTKSGAKLLVSGGKQYLAFYLLS